MEKQQELRKKMEEFQQMAADFERERQAANDRLVKPLLEKAEKVVMEYARRGGVKYFKSQSKTCCQFRKGYFHIYA